MSRIPLVFRAVALLFVLVVLPWPTAAESHQASKPNPVGSSVAAPLARLWSWLVGLWEKNGCAIDPGGHCLSGTAPVQPADADNGCGLDPHGRCIS